MLLRLTCLPRQKKLDDFFTFRLNDDSNCLPPYVYSSEHVQSFIDIVYFKLSILINYSIKISN